MSSAEDYNPVSSPGHHYSVSGRIKKRLAAAAKLIDSKQATTKISGSHNKVQETLTVNNSVNKMSFGMPGMARNKIGLERMGVKPESSSTAELDFSSPTFGPPCANFWHDPCDPAFDITDKFFVLRVNAPNKFWVQNQRQSYEFQALEKEMTEWYNYIWENEAEPMRHIDIIEGGFYAAYLEAYSLWARVRVVECVYGDGVNKREYLVHILDYGSEKLLTLENLYYLRHTYLKLPMQSAQMELYNEEESHAFTIQEKAQFKKDIGGKEIYVIVLSVQRQYDFVFPVLRAVLMNRCIQSVKERLQKSDFYCLNGSIQVEQLLNDIAEFQKH